MPTSLGADAKGSPRTLRTGAHGKDWDRIMASIDTPDGSDAEDGVNVVKIQKNAQSVCDNLHHLLPGLDATYRTERNMPSALDDSSSFRDAFEGVVALSEARLPPPSSSDGPPPVVRQTAGPLRCTGPALPNATGVNEDD